MPTDRQAVSRLRSRGPRRVVPPASSDRKPHDLAPAAQVDGGSHGRRPTPGGPSPDDGSNGSGDATADAGRVRGFTRSGRLRRMWLDTGPGYRIWAGGPVPRGASAWTLDRLVIVRRRRAHDHVLMAHEEEHVRQWAERGRVGFLAWYLRHYLAWRMRGYPHAAAYRRIPAEIEAEWRSRRRLGIGSTDPSGDMRG